MKKRKNIIVIILGIITVIMVLSVIYSDGREDNEVNQDQIESMIKDIDVILNGEEKDINKANEILKLFADEKNKGDLNSHELNLVINNYESNLIQEMLDADYNSLDEYNNSLKFIYGLRMISGYQLKPWQNIETIDINGQNIEVVTNTKDYEIKKSEELYFSNDPVGDIPKYFDFDAWLSLLEDVLSKESPEKYSNNENISNGFKIIEEWTSQAFIVQELNNLFLAYTYNPRTTANEYKTVDGITVFIMLIYEQNNVIDLEGLYKFGEKYSISKGVEYLNETYGIARGNDFKMIYDWLDESITDPRDGSSSTRESVLTWTDLKMKDWLTF